MKPEREWLDSLAAGQRLLVSNGSAGVVAGKVSRITEKLIFVRIGKELRRFTRADGGTFQAPTMSKSWLMPMEVNQ